MRLHLLVAARTDLGCVRSKNEDTFLATDLTRGESSTPPLWAGRFELGDRGALLSVSDGMGGAQAGEVASALVVSSLAHALGPQSPGRPSRERITDAVEDAHHSVWVEAHKRGIKMGATLTAVYVRGDAAYVAEVGDSRAYLIRAGHITQLTKDQSYVQMLVDSGAVAPEQAQGSPVRNIILQAMGHQPKLSIALGRLELRHRDCLLLCSDGLSTKVSDDRMREVVLTSPDLPSAAESLIDLANDRGGEDNATVVLGAVGGDLPAPEVGEPVDRTYRMLETFEAPVSVD